MGVRGIWSGLGLLKQHEWVLESPVVPQEELVSTSQMRGTPHVVPLFQKMPMSQCTPDTPDSLASDSTVTTRTNSKHDGGCDSPVAPREKATDPYVNPTGSLILLFLLQRRADVHVSIEMRPNTLWKPQRNPEILLDTGEETEGSGLNSR